MPTTNPDPDMQWPPQPSPFASQPTQFEDLRPQSRRSSGSRSGGSSSISVASAMHWLTRVVARSPTTTADKRRANDYFLPMSHTRSKSKSSSRSASPCRSSADLESQASTLLGELSLEKDTGRRSQAKVDARVVSDVIIGLSDGLTVPFALTAGLSALGNTKVVIFAGLAELTAGAISMGLGGYLAAKSEEESYKATLKSTRSMAYRSSGDTVASIRDIFEPYDLPVSLTEELASHMVKSPNLVQFLMNFQHNAPEQEPSRAMMCALTIACGYFMGGFLPLIPYFLVGADQVALALYWSFGFMALSLFSFGYSKTCFYCGWAGGKNIWSGCRGGFQMMLVGGAAAVCAMSLVRLFDSFAMD